MEDYVETIQRNIEIRQPPLGATRLRGCFYQLSALGNQCLSAISNQCVSAISYRQPVPSAQCLAPPPIVLPQGPKPNVLPPPTRIPSACDERTNARGGAGRIGRSPFREIRKGVGKQGVRNQRVWTIEAPHNEKKKDSRQIMSHYVFFYK